MPPPFIACWAFIAGRAITSDIVLLFSCRDLDSQPMTIDALLSRLHDSALRILQRGRPEAVAAIRARTTAVSGCGLSLMSVDSQMASTI